MWFPEVCSQAPPVPVVPPSGAVEPSDFPCPQPIPASSASGSAHRILRSEEEDMARP
jgi:hypothetical protein